MEPEATPQGDTLAASIGIRRRSHSVSDDYSVQRTNDDATQGKYAAVQLGYWEDEAIHTFISFIGEPALRRDPKISIGCGFDMLFFRLSAMGKKFIKFVDVDFSSVMSKKMQMVLKPGKPEVAKYFNESLLSQWKLDFSSSSRHARTSDYGFNPPGFSSNTSVVQQHVDAEQAADQTEHLARKRAWDVAMGPAKQLPMNMFMMYMAGKSVSIFPIMVVGMLIWRPVKAMFSVGDTFKPLQEQNTGSMIVHKLVYILGNLGAIAIAIYKVHTMGLLPNTPSDWLEFIPQAERVQYSLTSDSYV